jgi:hypothetical protein
MMVVEMLDIRVTVGKSKPHSMAWSSCDFVGRSDAKMRHLYLFTSISLVDINRADAQLSNPSSWLLFLGTSGAA